MVGRSPAVNRGMPHDHRPACANQHQWQADPTASRKGHGTSVESDVTSVSSAMMLRKGDKNTNCIFLAVHARQSQQDPMYHLKSKDWITEPVAISVPAVRGSIISAKATAINPKLMQWAHSGFLSHCLAFLFGQLQQQSKDETCTVDRPAP